LNRKLTTLLTIIILAILHAIGRDELDVKLDGFLTNQIRIMHFVFVPIIGYLISNYFSKDSDRKFYTIFFILNLLSLFHFSSKAISNRLINSELRKSLNSKIVNLEYSGWGYEVDSMTYNEYNEINTGYYPKLPRESKNIFLFEWYEFDARHEVEFSVSKKFNLTDFYINDTTILNKIREVKFNEFSERHKIVRDRVIQKHGQQQFDTMNQKRFKWERSFE